MDKLLIMPQVVVYRNMFSEEEINFLLNEINKTKSYILELDKKSLEASAYMDQHGPQPEDRGDGSSIYTWAPWYTFGIKSIWSNKENATNDGQKKGFKIIQDVLHKVHLDYVSDWKSVGVFPYDVKNWNLNSNLDDNDMVLSNFELLKHNININDKYAIDPHTDWHPHRFDEPGPKQILTYTVYLNDDYDGGEVDFVNEKDKCLIAYKPKRGDVTVFPSGAPFWHGARSVKNGNNKIFIRTFALFKYEGSKEWNRGLLSYGPTKWMEMHNKKVKERVDSGNVGRQIVFSQDEIEPSMHTLPLVIEKEIYIDGRDL